MQELRGMPVVNSLAEKFQTEIERLKNKDIIPKLAVVRVGEREDDIAYENGILKRFSNAGALAEITLLPNDVTQEQLEEEIVSLNQDVSVHGILIFRPLPKHLSEERIKLLIAAEKDVDCMGITNTANVFSGSRQGYPPCTPQAVIELTDYYGIDLTGGIGTITTSVLLKHTIQSAVKCLFPIGCLAPINLPSMN